MAVSEHLDVRHGGLIRKSRNIVQNFVQSCGISKSISQPQAVPWKGRQSNGFLTYLPVAPGKILAHDFGGAQNWIKTIAIGSAPFPQTTSSTIAFFFSASWCSGPALSKKSHCVKIGVR